MKGYFQVNIRRIIHIGVMRHENRTAMVITLLALTLVKPTLVTSKFIVMLNEDITAQLVNKLLGFVQK